MFSPDSDCVEGTLTYSGTFNDALKLAKSFGKAAQLATRRGARLQYDVSSGSGRGSHPALLRELGEGNFRAAREVRVSVDFMDATGTTVGHLYLKRNVESAGAFAFRMDSGVFEFFLRNVNDGRRQWGVAPKIEVDSPRPLQ
ncbi:MAG: hypothetical protein EOM26_06740 [Alphaproteobacteria bacterium]|nr:hypothetical protein [Alphaproteobacteria bacterium]